VAKKSSKPAERKPRTDAQPNRERILRVAKEVRGDDFSFDSFSSVVAPGQITKLKTDKDAVLAHG